LTPNKNKELRTTAFFYFISILVFVIAVAKIVFHLKSWIIPLVFFSIGLLSSFMEKEKALYLFVFLLPFINSTPSLFSTDYSFNYIAPALFLLSGMVWGMVFRKGLKPARGSWQLPLSGNFNFYNLFILFLFISFIFVMLRWSNITIDSYAAVGANTPVSPGVRSQRISFATIFPVVTLFIYIISPYLFFLFKKIKPDEKKIFSWLSCGFAVSVLIAVMQRIFNTSLISDRLGKELKQYYGGFSDFNAFGFFSGVMFLWSTYQVKKKNTHGYITLFVSLAGCILSGSRTALVFILAGIFNLLFKQTGIAKKKQKLITIVLIGLILISVLVVGGTLTKRLSEGFSSGDSLFEKLNAITNGRLGMTWFSLETIKDNFIPGVGTGNFTFYLDYKNFGKDYLYDLTLNQYTLIFTENGIFAFIFFSIFLVLIFRNSAKKLLIGTIFFSLLLNNFFWFPEAYLLFWILAALYENNKDEMINRKIFDKKYKKVLIVLSILIFISANVIQFGHLHPKTWAKATRTGYDYGFWYKEKDVNGNVFQWTRHRAGIYINLDKNGESPRIRLFCGAPLNHLPKKKQEVEIYWKGKLYDKVVFTGNKEFHFRIKSLKYEPGFLEIKVTPTFNLKKLGLGLETRDIGIQFGKAPGKTFAGAITFPGG
jgi:hypothetical protein